MVSMSRSALAACLVAIVVVVVAGGAIVSSAVTPTNAGAATDARVVQQLRTMNSSLLGVKNALIANATKEHRDLSAISDVLQTICKQNAAPGSLSSCDVIP